MHDWINWVANGLPILLLLGLWVFFMSRSKGCNWLGIQRKQVELMEAQLMAIRQTNELLKKMIEAR